jgi:NADPH-dependent 2,4-dienoyl-CoA reductase/sulfur reductase-like enzyme/nitrite reductase/ring-hydroxylating ferredoxin subunit
MRASAAGEKAAGTGIDLSSGGLTMNREQVVARTSELADGQMKEVQVEDRTILLVRVDGKFKAYVPECPHHGAPLVEGLLHEGRLRCPWHQAVFDALSGDLLEPPALDRLRNYDVRVEGEEVIVVIPREPAATAVPPTMASFDPDADARTFAIIGAGAAGLAAAETLRHEGFRGRIVVFTPEQHVSYDRTELSKGHLARGDDPTPTIRKDEFYEAHGIEVLTRREVLQADTDEMTVTGDDGLSLKCDAMLIATGCLPRTLGVEGEKLNNVFTLRSLEDCERIRRAAEGASKAVVVGASFIGMEVAASLSQRGLSVTVVAPERVPFERVFGERIGLMYRRVHEERGVAFRLGQRVERFEGIDGEVRCAVLKSGEWLDADIVVVGVGVRPATDFIKGVDPNEDGGLTVDSHLRVTEGVFAAGDVARFPDWRTGEPIRIEHWRLAQQHGRAAARCMLGKDAPYRGVPFFWTSQHKVITQYVGWAGTWDEVEFDGDPAEGQFLAFYLSGGRVVAAAGCERSLEMDAIAEMLKLPARPTLDEVRDELHKIGSLQHA